MSGIRCADITGTNSDSKAFFREVAKMRYDGPEACSRAVEERNTWLEKMLAKK